MHSCKTRRRAMFAVEPKPHETPGRPTMQQTSLPRAAYAAAPYQRQAFHRPHTAMGAAGHWIKTLGILSPPGDR